MGFVSKNAINHLLFKLIFLIYSSYGFLIALFLKIVKEKRNSLSMAPKKRILIDSALQHASAALNLPSYVFWIGTSPNVFGYKIHTNIVANKPKIFNQLIYSYDSNFNLAYNDIECPYFSPEDIFNVKETLKVLEYTNKDIILHQNL